MTETLGVKHIGNQSLYHKNILYKQNLNNNVLFACGFSSHSKNFHSHGDVTMAGEGLQILTYARHSWPLNSECSLACNTYCDTGHPFIIIFEDP